MKAANQHDLNTFLNDPADFLKYNEVFWLGGAPKDQAIIDVMMLDYEGPGARIRTGSRAFGKGNLKRTVPQFVLKVNDPSYGAPIFQAHWSGYAAGLAKDAALANAGPNIMLTPELTGCTVVCAVAPNGSAQFSHYNLTKAGTAETLDMAGMQLHAAQTYGPGHTTLSKEEYRAEGKHSDVVKVTVIGVRDTGNRWSFWAQFRESKASGQQIRLVRKLA